MNYYIDFDGTIVDVWKRYYTVFCAAFGVTVSFEWYKKNKIALKDDSKIIYHAIGKVPDEKFMNDYKAKKREFLEIPKYLRYDRLLASREKLCTFFRENRAFILSCRQEADGLIEQLKQLDIYELKEKVFVLQPKGIETKKSWLALREKEQAIMIGDAEIDIVAGELTNIKTIFCTSGLRGADIELMKLADKTVRTLNDVI